MTSSETRTGKSSSGSSIRSSIRSSSSRSSRSSRAGTTTTMMMAKKGAMACLVLLSSCGRLQLAPGGHANKQVAVGGPMMLAEGAQQLDFETRYGGNDGGGGGDGGDGSAAAHPFYRRHRHGPRILTVLTTYSNRTAYAKANREAIEERKDGYAPVVVSAILNPPFLEPTPQHSGIE